ncbi:MAG: hypothetical protein ACOZBW_10970, partial [Thermodesulfobacteriota bacterium]
LKDDFYGWTTQSGSFQPVSKEDEKDKDKKEKEDKAANDAATDLNGGEGASSQDPVINPAARRGGMFDGEDGYAPGVVSPDASYDRGTDPSQPGESPDPLANLFGGFHGSRQTQAEKRSLNMPGAANSVKEIPFMEYGSSGMPLQDRQSSSSGRIAPGVGARTVAGKVTSMGGGVGYQGNPLLNTGSTAFQVWAVVVLAVQIGIFVMLVVICRELRAQRKHRDGAAGGCASPAPVHSEASKAVH